MLLISATHCSQRYGTTTTTVLLLLLLPVLRASGARGPVQIVPSAFARHHMMGFLWFSLRIITLRCPLYGISLSWNPSLPFTY